VGFGCWNLDSPGRNFNLSQLWQYPGTSIRPGRSLRRNAFPARHRQGIAPCLKQASLPDMQIRKSIVKRFFEMESAFFILFLKFAILKELVIHIP
jgi:hypothetical protein